LCDENSSFERVKRRKIIDSSLWRIKSNAEKRSERGGKVITKAQQQQKKSPHFVIKPRASSSIDFGGATYQD
jgi:hypothetical protein